MFRDSEHAAFESMYRRHYEAVLRYCARRIDATMAQDATAETFTVAWRRWSEVPREAALPWLYGVAWKVLGNQRRSQRRFLRTARKASTLRGAPEPGPELTLIRRSEEAAVQKALERLSPSDQELIRLAAWEELSREDLGVALGISANAASKRLGRALDRLATQMGATRAVGARFANRERRGA